MSFQTRLTSLQQQLLQMTTDPSVTRLPEQQSKKLADLLKSAKSLISQAARLYESSGGVSKEQSAKQQLWERKLLDFSMHNSLLNMNVGRKAVAFPVLSISSLEDDLQDGNETTIENHELRHIWRDARSSVEETGAHTLFLTLGTLCWKENTTGHKQHHAPILLMPVDMVNMGKDRFAIRKRDEDVVLNITLVEYLRQNYGMDCPQLTELPHDEHGVDVSLVIHLFSQMISEEEEWSVSDDSYIGIFSFAKFVMWNDIHTHPEVLSDNPLLRSLVEGRLLVKDIDDPADARAMDPTMRPDAMAIPMDCDSSQIEAVADAVKGRTFCLYGPPGTGKSQSITNMIADAMFEGKRVLFVAQKKAALDVVQKRLEKIGLGPYCLEMHSNKADRKHFLEQMQRILDTAGSKPDEEFNRIAADLFSQRVKLSSYVSALHKKQQNGLSLHDCIDRYLSIDGELVHLKKDWTLSNGSDEVERLCNECLELEAGRNTLGQNPSDHPLRDLFPKAQPSRQPYTSYMRGETLAEAIPSLKQIVDNVRRQVNGPLNKYSNKTARQYLEADYKWKKFLQLADVSDSFYSSEDAMEEAVNRWNSNLELLPDWQKYSAGLDKLRSQGFGDAVDIYLSKGAGKAAADAFRKGYYYQAALDIIAHDNELSNFNGLAFGEVIEKYNTILRNFQKTTRSYLSALIASRIPLDTTDPQISSELTLLRKRISNRGRGTTVRGIIDQMPHLLPVMCPCMLMSPLSVSQFIDMGSAPFDIVVFDEASQLPTCEAIGSIARASSMVVVGDPKQMPPTSFFTTTVTGDDEQDIDDMESILDDCISLSVPSRYLSWHYRSNHESLIAFSNRNYYDGKLITFPSPDDLVSHVQYRYVEGIYDSGKTRTNKAEAIAVVDEVIRRLDADGLSRSIGIVSFNKNQAELIEDLLSERLADRPDLFTLNQNAQEPIFVKNLENVQGDERDIIIFSVGYGPDSDGKISLNFGPLNQVGGERRLNVAVSRSRYEMMIFSSLKPEQIDPRRTSSEGAMGLRRFLEYARCGNSILSDSAASGDCATPLADEIASRLEERGYVVKKDVGTSSFRIDLAVVDPGNSGKYILGIICDGERYYSLKTVRDRETVQPSVLKRLGWNTMHVWSVDWLGNPDAVMNIISSRLEDLVK